MKLVVVGGVAGGASAAARARRLDESAEIIIFERGECVSYSSCSLPYYLGGVVADAEDLVMMTPEDFRDMHNIDVRTGCCVTAIYPAAKTVTVRDVRTGEEHSESYDKLLLSPGAAPILPASIEGIRRENVFAIRSVEDIVRLKGYLDSCGERVAVVGGGFIGIETAENLRRAGKSVALIEGLGQIMAPFDADIVQILHKELVDNGVELYLNSSVTAVEAGRVRAKKAGAEFSVPADAVIMAIGAAPETALARAAGLELGATRGIRVNEYFQTSDADIYAVGDAIESFNRLTGAPGRLALAGPAQRQARIAANHMFGLPGRNLGFLGSCCVRVFGMNAAATGLSEKSAAAAGLKYDSATVYASDRVGLMPGAGWLAVKLVFETPTGRLLGAQAIGAGEADKRVDAAAAIISMGGTVEDAAEYEHCYAPMFSTARDALHMAALTAENVLSGALRQVPVTAVRGLWERGECIVDVREPGEYAAGHIKGAKNVPLSQLRERLGDIPRDVPVYLHCRSAQRSYYACRCLRGRGFENVWNISGSFLGLCLYEYYTDVAEGREPMVTEYNFN